MRPSWTSGTVNCLRVRGSTRPTGLFPDQRAVGLVERVNRAAVRAEKDPSVVAGDCGVDRAIGVELPGDALVGHPGVILTAGAFSLKVDFSPFL